MVRLTGGALASANLGVEEDMAGEGPVRVVSKIIGKPIERFSPEQDVALMMQRFREGVAVQLRFHGEPPSIPADESTPRSNSPPSCRLAPSAAEAPLMEWSSSPQERTKSSQETGPMENIGMGLDESGPRPNSSAKPELPPRPLSGRLARQESRQASFYAGGQSPLTENGVTPTQSRRPSRFSHSPPPRLGVSRYSPSLSVSTAACCTSPPLGLHSASAPSAPLDVGAAQQQQQQQEEEEEQDLKHQRRGPQQQGLPKQSNRLSTGDQEHGERLERSAGGGAGAGDLSKRDALTISPSTTSSPPVSQGSMTSASNQSSEESPKPGRSCTCEETGRPVLTHLTVKDVERREGQVKDGSPAGAIAFGSRSRCHLPEEQPGEFTILTPQVSHRPGSLSARRAGTRVGDEEQERSLSPHAPERISPLRRQHPRLSPSRRPVLPSRQAVSFRERSESPRCVVRLPSQHVPDQVYSAPKVDAELGAEEVDEAIMLNLLTWQELENSCRELDLANVRISGIDLTALTEADISTSVLKQPEQPDPSTPQPQKPQAEPLLGRRSGRSFLDLPHLAAMSEGSRSWVRRRRLWSPLPNSKAMPLFSSSPCLTPLGAHRPRGFEEGCERSPKGFSADAGPPERRKGAAESLRELQELLVAANGSGNPENFGAHGDPTDPGVFRIQSAPASGYLPPCLPGRAQTPFGRCKGERSSLRWKCHESAGGASAEDDRAPPVSYHPTPMSGGNKLVPPPVTLRAAATPERRSLLRGPLARMLRTPMLSRRGSGL